jgi:putative chitinase
MRADEFAIVEKKRRKRRPRWAAYGPGPYGGYGYYAGYSGDSGGDGGGVGEASYEGNVGMMEVSKFFKMATAAQKKLFKELLEKGKRGLAWKLIQDVTDTRLQGREFEIGEDRTADVVFDTGEQRRVRYLPTTKDIVDTIIKYYLKQGLKVVKVDDEEIAWDGANEGWRDTLAGLALGGAVAMGGAQAKGVDTGEKYHGYSEPIQLIQKVDKGDTVYSLAREFGVTPRDIQRVNKLDKDFTIKPGQELAIPEKSKDSAKADFQYKKSDEPKSTTKSLYDNADEKTLLNALVANGFRGAELAAFMAQAAHETRNFGSLVEEGSKRYFMRYDPSSKNPDHKKTARRLGNTKAGDGERFKGRGHLQITGRWNYGAVGRLIGVDLIKNPELLEKPAIAAKASIAFWKMRVQPNVTDYNNVRQVTLPINSGLDKLSQRTSTFKNYKQLLVMK